MAFQQELDLYLRARFTLIVLVTPEEERAVAEVRQACEAIKRPCLSWDAGDGFEKIAYWNGTVPAAPDPKTARADSKCQIGSGFGCRIAIASSVVMSCITACMPVRID
jgi:hypothetical protein